MNARLILLAGLVVAAVVPRLTGTVVEPMPVTGKIQWVLKYSEGQKLAREMGKPLFVVFRCER